MIGVRDWVSYGLAVRVLRCVGLLIPCAVAPPPLPPRLFFWLPVSAFPFSRVAGWGDACAFQLIAEGSGEDEEADTELRRDAVDMYMDLLDTPAVHDQVRQKLRVLCVCARVRACVCAHSFFPRGTYPPDLSGCF